MSSEPIALPAAVQPPRRPPIPFVAALVPVAAGIVLWTVTGSVLSLCFALLGPLMIGGSLLDGIRQRRRELKRLTVAAEDAWARAEAEITQRHLEEGERLWRRHPDVARCLIAEPLHDDHPVDAGTVVVIGRGERTSETRVTGGDDGRGRELRRRAATLVDAPVTVPLGRGVCIRAPRPVGLAIARALLAQLCLRHLPGRLALVGPLPEGWAFAQARSSPRGAWRVSIGLDAPAAVADSTIRVCGPDDPVPDGITTVIDCVDPSDALLRIGDRTQRITAECVSAAQLQALALASADRAVGEAELPDRVRLSDLAAEPGGILPAVLGTGVDAAAAVDLVADGPHAIVTGMTGAGKSELLITWVASLARTHGPDQVVFVLADFKGGTAFDPLAGLPHVTAVLTDLDEDGARRGVESLTSELRRRERVLAEAGAKDISGTGVRMPRLVIVVDEFAALVQEHPDLGAVFTDIAARGRALGMHLILGTQRAAGVIRDALAANCPLRMSLRVSDPADSRLVIGSEAAAELEGGSRSRGIAFVRRPQDAEAAPLRVALTGPEDLRAIGALWSHAERPSGPWLPALPTRLPLLELPGTAEGEIAIGLADEPHRQRQPVITLRPGRERGLGVIGGPGAGKSLLLRVLRSQEAGAFTIPADPEHAWDVLGALERGEEPARLVLCDDLDRLLSAYPTEYALAFAERFEQFVRAAEERCVVVTAGRASGATARILDALSERLLLRLPTRGDHLAAGGESATFRRDRPPGRGHLGEREVQVAWADPGMEAASSAGAAASAESRAGWIPQRRLVAVISTGAAGLLDALREAYPAWQVVPAGPAAVQSAGSGNGLPTRPGDDPHTRPRDEPGAELGNDLRTRPGDDPRTRPAGIPSGRPGDAGCIIVGDAESWQRDWTRWQRVRAEGEILVLSECAAQLRTLVGVRELPPYARPHQGRAWRVLDGGPPERVILPRGSAG
ncbi:FtsK/SpoIIIE domain-containing protein [Microbacterium sp. CIAB417]|uniref:FtsK/SpoIIIE domain-containing protein n=1 Tax=Microbacterium sp. CIAB417 TaxID=2860287 RepID=UPI001FAE6763|nr:FtsK/SpoIIIE domain-containing protein [Microbacterium sp. CIAB417]